MTELLRITPVAPYLYVGWAVIIPLLIRIFIAVIETRRLSLEGGFWKIFRGFGDPNPKKPGKDVPADYWLAFILGMLEMLAYPPVLAADQPTFIGAWLVFKTVHRWSYAPGFSRGPYNRYLVANGIILLASYLSARWWF